MNKNLKKVRDSAKRLSEGKTLLAEEAANEKALSRKHSWKGQGTTRTSAW